MPTGKLGEPSDVANAVGFLASDDSQAEFPADGVTAGSKGPLLPWAPQPWCGVAKGAQRLAPPQNLV
jgi:hypothetical protein